MKYVTPEMELMEFEATDICTLSIVGPTDPPDIDGDGDW